MKHRRVLITSALAAFLAALPFPVSGQISLLGRRPEDKFLTNFWSQNLNASNAVAGLNAHAATTTVKWVDALLPLTITGKILSGSFTGTNAFRLLSYDSILALHQVFDFTLTNNTPVGTNVVSRTGFPESLLYKTLYSAVLGTAGNPNTFLSGIVKANNGTPLTAITPASGDNKVYLRHVIGGVSTNWVRVNEGIVAELQFATNAELATAQWVSNYVSTAGSGDVNGALSATSAQIARFRDATGKVITNSVVMIDDTGAVTGVASLAASGLVSAKNFVQAVSPLTYAATVALDFAGDGTKTLALAGNLAFSTQNLAAGRTITIRLIGDGSPRSLQFPAGWKFLGAAAPAQLAANKTAVLTATSFAADDSNVIAAYSATP